MAYVFANAQDDLVLKVWKKGRVIEKFDPNVWSRDICGRAIKFEEHGKTTEHGWEIDLIKPQVKQGSDDLDNLQPLYYVLGNKP